MATAGESAASKTAKDGEELKIAWRYKNLPNKEVVISAYEFFIILCCFDNISWRVHIVRKKLCFYGQLSDVRNSQKVFLKLEETQEKVMNFYRSCALILWCPTVNLQIT